MSAHQSLGRPITLRDLLAAADRGDFPLDAQVVITALPMSPPTRVRMARVAARIVGATAAVRESDDQAELILHITPADAARLACMAERP